MSVKIVRTRVAGQCDSEFAHPSCIRPGDVVEVTTHFPRSEAVTAFGVAPFARTRRCTWCVARDMTTPYSRERQPVELVDRWHALTGTPLPEAQDSGAAS